MRSGEVVTTILVVFLVAAALIGGIRWAAVLLDQASCQQWGEAYGYATEWKFPAGCLYVKQVPQ